MLIACMAVSLSSCRETFENLFSDDIEEGEEVMFTTSLPTVATVTRADGAYTAPKEKYQFTIGMYTDELTKVAEGTYNTIVDDEIGTLEAVTPLYWPSTTTAYGFKATAGNETLETDQTAKDKWLLQDRLEGNAGYYKNAKDWKLYNKESKLVSNDEDYKKILLPMQHTRSLITVILKAGEGVSRQALAYAVASNDLSAEIYSYSVDSESKKTIKKITPLASEAFINYEEDKNGGKVDNVSTTRYDAIVEPYDYSEKSTEDTIAKISISGQKYLFYAGNDKDNLESYNLYEPGKHLTITVTLTRDSRKAMMSAYIEDWSEAVTTTICDDYGNAGEPIYIKNRDELVAFLNGDKNKAGNVALVKNDIALGDWTAYNLNCTLNLGGHKLTSNNRFLNILGEAANLQNGTIHIAKDVDAAIATTNEGVIEDVKITAEEGIHASLGGAVKDNHGTISKCRSSLMVSGGSEGYVGGIAATSLITEGKTKQTVVIDRCIVTNRVSGGAIGGGVVGHANGTITNNTFEYGITLKQDSTTHKNIVGVIESGDFEATKNAWPTYNTDFELKNAMSLANIYNGIIDSYDELVEAKQDKYNIATNRFCLAKNISVDATIGNVAYELDGNGKQITTNKMVFENITGKVHDLTIYVSDNLIATPTDKDVDFMAPLAYSVAGTSAELKNIIVKMADGKYIQAANPAGLVVWAGGGATISNCEVTADIRGHLKTPTATEYKFVGGIVSTASTVTISQCVFHSASTLTTDQTNATALYYGGIVGGVGVWSKETPVLTITDCSSFCKSYITDPEDAYHGGILGYSILKTTNANTTKDCQGNWWPNNKKSVASKGVAVCQSGTSEESTIGKRNGVEPKENK